MYTSRGDFHMPRLSPFSASPMHDVKIVHNDDLDIVLHLDSVASKSC